MKRMKRLCAAALVLALALAPVSPAVCTAYAFSPTSFVSAAKSGWVVSGTRTYYYQKGKRVKGIKKISGKYYIFNSNSGALLKNKIIYQYTPTKYYKIDENGVATRFKGTSYAAAKLLYTQMRSSKAFTMLKNGFRWAADCTFAQVPAPAQGTSPSTYYGQWGLTKHSGDCAVMAYTFYWMAKVLGYNVKVINGYYRIGTVEDPTYKEHSWCEIREKGVTYVYDPDFNHEYRDRITRTNYGFNSIGFKIRYGATYTLPYCRADKTEIEKGGKA